MKERHALREKAERVLADALRLLDETPGTTFVRLDSVGALLVVATGELRDQIDALAPLVAAERLPTRPPTLKAAQSALRLVGVTLRHSAEFGEYRVNLRGGREAAAYYTDDLADALATGHEIARRAGVRS